MLHLEADKRKAQPFPTEPSETKNWFELCDLEQAGCSPTTTTHRNTHAAKAKKHHRPSARLRNCVHCGLNAAKPKLAEVHDTVSGRE
jgi:hypothetical protein